MTYFDGTANYLAFRLLKKVKQYQTKKFQFVDYAVDERQHLVDRTVQALANWMLAEIRTTLFYRPEDILSAVEHGGWLRVFTNCKINFSTGEYQVGVNKKFIKEYGRFWFLWVHTFLAIFSFFGQKKLKMGQKNALIYGIPQACFLSKNATSKFEDFLLQNPIQPLKDLDGYIAQVSRDSKKELASDDNYQRFPEIAIVKAAELLPWQRLTLLFLHLGMCFKAHQMLVKNPAIILIFSDFASLAVMSKMDKWKFYSSIVITTSDTNKQQLWMRSGKSHKLHYLHYAALPLLVVNKDDPYPNDAAKELQFCFLADATHWVWSEHEKNLLAERYGYHRCEVSGPPNFVMKCARPNRKLTQKKPLLHVVVFDVTPAIVDHVRSFGTYYYYGRLETALRIIKDILEVVDEIASSYGLEPLVSLKPKREPTAIHSQVYLDFLKDEEERRQYFEICNPEAGITDVISSDCIVVSRPFTSAGLVARMGGVTSVYYDPTMSIIDNCPKETGMTLIQGRLALEQRLAEHARALSVSR
jgi:polysaccharide biosynthesis PFTS motif protein